MELFDLLTITITSYVLYLSYIFMIKFFTRFNDHFASLSYDHKAYAVKNIIKSVSLCFLSILSIPLLLYPILTKNHWNNRICHTFGIIYVLNDTIGLIMVKKLLISTKIHHCITTSFGFLNLFISYQYSLLGKMMFIYTLASAFAFTTNFYLGIRMFYKKKQLRWLKQLSFYIYTICCFVNWTSHILIIYYNFTSLYIQHYIYFSLLYFIIKDDLILLNWLKDN